MKSLGVLLVVAFFGCGSKKKQGDEAAKPADAATAVADSKPPSALTLTACKKQSGGACPFAYCGGNSAIINAFPLNGFRPNGDCNEDEVQLVPGSLNGPNCKDATLDIENGKLIGRVQPKNCEEQDLKDASFEIRATDKNNKPVSATIKITKVTEYGPGLKKFPAYQMEWTDNGAKPKLCSKDGQKLRRKLDVADMPYSDDLPDPSSQTENLVVPVVSELYDSTGTAVGLRSRWQLQELEWNHLACVDDALAKRMYSDLQVANPAKNRAALRMWTADYCGGNPFTLRGAEFQWEFDASLEVEARWEETGAKCLSAPRILRDEHGKETAPKKLTQRLKDMCKLENKNKDCNTAAEWLAVARNCTVGTNGGTSLVTSPKTLGACTGTCNPKVDANCAPQSQIVKK